MAREMHRPPVLADVARVAGVSIPTVSRSLTGSVPVSDKTRLRVDAAIRQLGYRPNGAARALVSGRQNLLSVLTSNTTRYGNAETLGGIEEAARNAELLVSITVVAADTAASVREAVDLVLGQPVAGVIVLEFDAASTKVLDSLPASLPTVSISAADSGRLLPRTLLDDERGGADATNYLLGLGHPTVHHVAVPGPGSASGRALGWRRALAAAGAAVPEVVEVGWTIQEGYATGLRLAQMAEVTAILCGNDEVAFGVIKALHDSGKRVPGDISVMGFDGHPHGLFWSPPLSTMVQDFNALGRAAVAQLIANTRDDQVVDSDRRFSAELLIRDSTAPPPH